MTWEGGSYWHSWIAGGVVSTARRAERCMARGPPPSPLSPLVIVWWWRAPLVTRTSTICPQPDITSYRDVTSWKACKWHPDIAMSYSNAEGYTLHWEFYYIFVYPLSKVKYDHQGNGQVDKGEHQGLVLIIQVSLMQGGCDFRPSLFVGTKF